MKIEAELTNIYNSLGKRLSDSLELKKRVKKKILENLLTENIDEVKKLVTKSFDDPNFLKTLRETFFTYTSVPYSQRSKVGIKSFEQQYKPSTIRRKNTMLAQKFGLGRGKNPLRFKLNQFKPNPQGQEYINRKDNNPDLTILYNYGDLRKQLTSGAFLRALGGELKTGKYTTLKVYKSGKSNEEKMIMYFQLYLKDELRLLESPALSRWADPTPPRGARNNKLKATLVLKIRHKKNKYDIFGMALRRAFSKHFRG